MHSAAVSACRFGMNSMGPNTDSYDCDPANALSAMKAFSFRVDAGSEVVAMVS